VTDAIRMIAALRSLQQQTAARLAESEARLQATQAENSALQRKLAAANGTTSPAVSAGGLLQELGRRIRRGIPH
jgi:hypothetical protein